ncbi:hypothetical protein I5M32_08750 [Pedobacter sp. SD-b]|uniref:Acetyltransferase (GNAT) domain-containing protein n=1 Tax=Pedobacter segetis TaxID=2793069 RepID=A0ABS1BJV6_9SPHI|nr:hypothetical protein [Pedobacter segetis]MBK0383046.1 hypothetical protein [Pedobacter segetis]
MSYSFLNIDVNDWELFINQYSEVNVFGTETFLKTTTSVYNCDLDIRVVLFNNKPILAVPLFIKGNKVVSPNHYYYQYIWEKETSKESWNQIEAWSFLIKELQKKYKEIKLRLPTKLKDVRPFIWNNFDIRLKYTYEKDLQKLTYNRNIKRILNHHNKKYSFNENCDWAPNWDFYNNDLVKLGVKKNDLRLYVSYFKGLKEINQLEVFNVYDDDGFITSILTIVDYKSKLAYFALMGLVEDKHYRKGLPTLLYDNALNRLKQKDILKVDFLGANMKSISKYKSNFLPSLEGYYEVFYAEFNAKNKKNWSKINHLIHKVLRFR